MSATKQINQINFLIMEKAPQLGKNKTHILTAASGCHAGRVSSAACFLLHYKCE